ncbi:hypothetical protein Dimus_025197 [Dionaea muscipula]
MLALGNVEHPGRSKISDDENRFNALQKRIEELEKELEDNRGLVQLLTDTVKEKERKVEELERRLRAELDDGNRVNASQIRIEELESQLVILNEVNRADVQKLNYAVKEKERSAKTLERELMQLRAELDDMRQRPTGPPMPTTTDDVVKEVDDFQYIAGFSDRWLRNHTDEDIVIINCPTDLFGEVVTGMISYEEAMYVCNQDEFAHTTMNLFMW